jgi:precorrin-2 dehydrogenase / sirohydrochlorin ferrochelatase
MKTEKSFYPLLLDLSGRKILVIGGGNVAARKINTLVEYNADITCIAPDVHIDIKKLAARGVITLNRKAFQQGDVEGFDLVFTATGDEVISELAREECLQYGALLNSADEADLSDFINPATLKRGAFTITLSSGGLAPFFVQHIKKKIEECIPAHLSGLTELAGLFRKNVIQKEYSDERKKELYNRFLSVDWNFILEYEGYPAAIKKLNILFEKDEDEEI